jgi:hypothetical protein
LGTNSAILIGVKRPLDIPYVERLFGSYGSDVRICGLESPTANSKLMDKNQSNHNQKKRAEKLALAFYL